MRKEGLQKGALVRVLREFKPGGIPSEFYPDVLDNQICTFNGYVGHKEGYQYEVIYEKGREVVVWDIELVEDNSNRGNFNVGDLVIWRDGYEDTIKKPCHSFNDSWYLSEKYNSCNHKGLTLVVKQQNQVKNMEEKINIGMERLVEYYNASTTEQKNYLTENFKLNGECTKEALIGLRDIACSTWKPQIEKNHPDVFKVETKWEDKWVQPKNQSFYRVDVDSSNSFSSSTTTPGSNRKPRHAFKTKEQANLMAEKCKLMIEMQNFAAVHNEGWVPNWKNSNVDNYGIENEDGGFIVSSNTVWNCFVFGITVENWGIAEKMLAEFGERINKYYNEQY